MWDDKTTLRFIDLYKDNPILWDHKHSNYYNKGLKNDAWADIAAALNTSSEECRKKMFSLQSSLRRERCKIRKSEAAAKDEEDVYKSSWFAFKSMAFLLEKDNPRRVASLLRVLSKEKERRDEKSSAHNSTQQHLQKRRRHEDAQDNLPERECPATSSSSSSKADDEDVCQLFGNLVVKKMRMYSPLVQSAVQQAVMNVLFNADRGYYDQKFSSSEFDPQYSRSQHPQHSQCSENCNVNPQYVQEAYSSRSSVDNPDYCEDYLSMSPKPNLCSPGRSPTPEKNKKFAL